MTLEFRDFSRNNINVKNVYKLSKVVRCSVRSQSYIPLKTHEFNKLKILSCYENVFNSITATKAPIKLTLILNTL